MVDSLDGLRHYAVICCYNQNSYVSNLCAARTHCGEGLMARGIKENNLLALIIYFISTDMLGNTASLTRGNIRFADSVQQRGFAVVNVAHNSDYRRTWQTLFRRIVNLRYFSRIFFRSLLAYLYAKVITNQLCGIVVDILVDRNHHAQHEQSLDNLIYFAFD